MSSQLVAAMFIGLMFGVLAESFEDEKSSIIFFGGSVILAFITGALFLRTIHSHAEAASAIALLCAGSVMGWIFSLCVNTQWRESSEYSETMQGQTAPASEGQIASASEGQIAPASEGQ